MAHKKPAAPTPSKSPSSSVLSTVTDSRSQIQLSKGILPLESFSLGKAKCFFPRAVALIRATENRTLETQQAVPSYIGGYVELRYRTELKGSIVTIVMFSEKMIKGIWPLYTIRCKIISRYLMHRMCSAYSIYWLSDRIYIPLLQTSKTQLMAESTKKRTAFALSWPWPDFEGGGARWPLAQQQANGRALALSHSISPHPDILHQSHW